MSHWCPNSLCQSDYIRARGKVITWHVAEKMKHDFFRLISRQKNLLSLQYESPEQRITCHNKWSRISLKHSLSLFSAPGYFHFCSHFRNSILISLILLPATLFSVNLWQVPVKYNSSNRGWPWSCLDLCQLPLCNEIFSRNTHTPPGCLLSV